MRLRESLGQNELLWECLRRVATLELPAWYVGAGCVAQTIWNLAHGASPTAHIADYDVVYFDPDLSADAEADVAARAGRLLADLPVRPDVKNQARVHLWYERRFGSRIRAYASSEDAISTWPTTATAIGVRLLDEGLSIHAPFGLGDLLALVVRPNRVQITPEIYRRKVERWIERWPLLDVRSWEEGIGTPGARIDVRSG